MLAKALVDFTLELFGLHCKWGLAVAVLEDLGAVTHGPYYQCRPASIWQFPALLKVLQAPGLPCLDSQGFYLGPIPRSIGHTSLVRRKG